MLLRRCILPWRRVYSSIGIIFGLLFVSLSIRKLRFNYPPTISSSHHQVQEYDEIENNFEESKDDILSIQEESNHLEDRNKTSSESQRDADGSGGIPPFPDFDVEANVNKSVDIYSKVVLWKIWNGDKRCDHYEGHLLKRGTHQPGALVSFPGSGNTWLRALLMGITSVFVTTDYVEEYDSYKLPANDSFDIQANCACSLLQKTHDATLVGDFYSKQKNKRTQVINHYKGKGILLIRNPFRALITYRNFLSGGMTGVAPTSEFNGQGWDNFVTSSISAWKTLATVWIKGLRQGGVIYYERLQHETRKELERLIQILGLKLDRDRYECVLRHINDNNWHRKKKNKDKWNPYTISQKQLIREAIDEVQLALKKRGLRPLPVHHYEFLT